MSKVLQSIIFVSTARESSITAILEMPFVEAGQDRTKVKMKLKTLTIR
jgi:hypothetical protein